MFSGSWHHLLGVILVLEQMSSILSDILNIDVQNSVIDSNLDFSRAVIASDDEHADDDVMAEDLVSIGRPTFTDIHYDERNEGGAIWDLVPLQEPDRVDLDRKPSWRNPVALRLHNELSAAKEESVIL